MSDKIDLDNVDDLDSLLAGLDDELGGKDQPKEFGTREAVNEIGKGALDAILDKDNQLTYTKTIVKNALPPGFKMAVNATDTALADATSIYEKAMKPLRKPLSGLKAEVAKRADSVSFLSDTMKDRLKKLAPENDAPSADAIDVNQITIDKAMADVFKAPTGKVLDGQARDLQRQTSYKNVQLGSSASINESLSRLVGYNEGINYRYQQKTLELQHMQFFTMRDLLTVFKAYAKDTDIKLSSVVHNTALPDFQKIKLSEGLQQEQLGRLFGNVSETMNQFTGKYRERLVENVTKKATDFTQGVGNALTGATDILGTGDTLGELGPEAKYGIAGGVVGGGIGGVLADKIGKRLRKALMKDPRIRNKSNELMYIFENYPSYFNNALKDWDGGVLPEAILKRFPALEVLNASFLKSHLLDILPKLERQDLTLTSPELEDLTQATNLDVAMRQSVVEVIPTLISRSNQLLETLVTGNTAGREVYDYKTRSLAREDDLATKEKEGLFANVAARRGKQSDALIKLLGLGSGVDLTEEDKDKLRDVILKTALSGEVFDVEKFKQKDYGDSQERITTMLEASTGNISQRNLSGARILREMGTGQEELQKTINAYSGAGQVGVLRSMGLISDNPYNEAVINQDAFTAMNRPTSVAEVSLGSPMAGFVPDNATTASMPSIEALTKEDLQQIFFKLFEDQEAIPVYDIRRDFKETRQEETLNPQTDSFMEIVRQGFSDNNSFLDNILGAILRGGADGSGEANSPRPGKDWRGLAGSILSSPLRAAKLSMDLGNTTLATGLNLAKGLFKRTAGMTGDKVKDIYVHGNPAPILRASQIKAGAYVDASTGKVITSLDDIEGEVVDKAGNVVLSAEDVKKGLYDAAGTDVSSLFSMIKAPFEHALSFNRTILSLVNSVPRAMLAKADAFKKRIRDVYVAGEAEPRLRSYLLKSGAYFSKKTGKVIRSVEDIDGTVVDGDGNVVLSAEEMHRGLVDRFGQKIDASGLLSMASNLVNRGVTLGRNVLMGGVKFGQGVITGAGDIVGQFFNRFSNVDSAVKSTSTGDETLDKILAYMKQRWPMQKVKASDRDSDNVRDNSYADFLRADKEAKADNVDNQDAQTDKPKKTARETKGTASILNPLGFLSGIMGDVGGKLGTLVDIVKSIGTTVAAWFAFSRTTQAASDIGDLADGMGGGKAKKGGLIKRAISGVGKIGKGLLKGGGKVASLAATAGGFVLRKGLQVGASALAVAAGAPVLATAAAVAGIGYTGYKIYKYFSSRKEPKDLERLRFLQYGFNPSDKDNLSKLRWLEGEMDDEVTIQSGKARFSLSISEAADEWAEEFGIDMENAGQVRMWSEWFAKRFFPVYMRSRQVAYSIDKDVDFEDLDDDLSKEKISEYVMQVTGSSAYVGGNPLAVMSSPIIGLSMLSNVSAIDALVAKLTIKPVKPVKEDVKPSEVAADAVMDSAKVNRADIDQAVKDRKTSTASYPTTSDYTKNTLEKSIAKNGIDVAPIRAANSVVATPKGSKSIKLKMPCTGTITSPYGMRVHPVTGSRSMHKGVDIADSPNTPIHASADGVIYRLYRSKTYGNVVYLKHDNGMATRYAHMSGFASGLRVGVRVQQGALLGYMGTTGVGTGIHLHWELRVSTDQWAETLDPLQYVEGNAKRDLAKEEKTIKAEDKAASKETDESTLEGQETIRSTLLPDEVKLRTKETRNGQIAKPKKPEVTPEAKAMESSIRTQASSMKSLESYFSRQETSEGKAFDQRNAMIENQGEMIRLMGELVNAIVGEEGLTSTLKNKEFTPMVSSNNAKTKRSLRPEVNMS